MLDKRQALSPIISRIQEDSFSQKGIVGVNLKKFENECKLDGTYIMNVATFDSSFRKDDSISDITHTYERCPSSYLPTIMTYMLNAKQFKTFTEKLYSDMASATGGNYPAYMKSIINCYYIPCSINRWKNTDNLFKAASIRLYNPAGIAQGDFLKYASWIPIASVDSPSEDKYLTCYYKESYGAQNLAPIYMDIPPVDMSKYQPTDNDPKTELNNMNITYKAGAFGEFNFNLNALGVTDTIGARVYFDFPGGQYRTVLKINDDLRPEYAYEGTFNTNFPLLEDSLVQNWSAMRISTIANAGIQAASQLAGIVTPYAQAASTAAIIEQAAGGKIGNVSDLLKTGGVLGGVSSAIGFAGTIANAAVQMGQIDFQQQYAGGNIKGTVGSSKSIIDITVKVIGQYQQYIDQGFALRYGYPDGRLHYIPDLSGYIQTMGIKLTNPKGLPASIINAAETKLNSGCYLS